MKNIYKLPLFISVLILSGLFFAGVAFAGTTPAISSATFESTGAVTGLLVEFNVPVWTDAALTGGLTNADFVFADGNSGAGATNITATVAHTAGDDFAILTLNVDPVAGDTADTIRAVANGIFTVGGALSTKTVVLTDDAGTAPAISTATVLSGKPRIKVTFSKRVWSTDTSGAPDTSAPAVADFVGTTPGADGCATAASAYAANLLARPGARTVILDCGENASAADTGGTPDTIAAASATSLFDLWGNDMGTATTAFTSDAAGPTITGVEAVKDSTLALVRFSEAVFTDDPGTGTNSATFANADITYTDGSATAGATAISATAANTGTSQSFMLIGTTGYALLTLNAAVSIADLSGGATDDSIDAAANNTAIFDANGTGMATGGTLANRTLNDTTDPVILSVTLVNTDDENTLSLLYSEDVTITGSPAAGLTAVSTAALGDLTTAGTIAGLGAFATAGNVTYRTLSNTVVLTAAGTTFSVSMASQPISATLKPLKTAGSTEPSGTFTPQADEGGALIEVVDLAPTPNKIEATSIQSTITGGGSWDLTAPTAPGNFSVAGSSGVSVNLNWQPSAPASDFDRYEVYYRTTGSGVTFADTPWSSLNDGNFTLSATGNTIVTGLSGGLTYNFIIYAIDIDGNVGGSNEVSVMSSSQSTADVTPPGMPTDFKASVDANGKIILTWTDPTATDLKNIFVLRGKNGAPINGLAYATVLKGLKTYTDADVTPGDTVQYILRASDTSNNLSILTVVVEVKVPAVSTTPPAPAPAPEVIPPPAPEEMQPVEETAPVLSENEIKIEKLQKRIQTLKDKIAKLDKKKNKKKIKSLKKLIKKYRTQIKELQY